MKFIILSFCKSLMLCYILLCLTCTFVKCFNPDLTYQARNYSREDFRPLFQGNAVWKQGDIPLLNRKVFRGTRVSVREHPYVASVRRNIMHHSVATMLTKNLFITVAHPLIDVPLDEIGVVVGENYADRGATLLTVVLIIIHENFDRYTLASDLALLRSYEDNPFRCSVKAIQLVHPNKALNGLRAFVTGWGRCDRTGRELCLPRSSKYTPGEKFDPMLRSVSFVVRQPNFFCEGYKRNGVRLKPGMICVGQSREEDKVTPCLAIPGAPLVVDGNLAALLSWGYGCGYEHDLPLIYTNIQYYQPWLLHNVPLIRRIDRDNLTILFEAKRAFILTKWLNLTRVIRPQPFALKNKAMVMMKLDRELAKLRGHVFDIRDVLFNGLHHKYKKKLYAKLRQKESFKDVIQKEHEAITTPRLVPFLNANETDLEGPEENVLLDGTNSDSDKSYGDY